MSYNTELQNNNQKLRGILEDVNNLPEAGESVADAVRYTAQSLTEEQKAQARANIAALGKMDVSLGIASDGLIYLFVNGQPVGTGIPQGQSGDVFGYVDENNTIVLTGSLPDGSYNIKYEMKDGSTVDIGNLELGEEAEEIVNLFDATSSDAGYGRLGSDGSLRTDAPNNFVTNYIAVENGDVIRVSGCDVCTSYSMAGYDSSKAKVFSQMINSAQSYFTLDNLTDNYAQLTITSDTVKFLRFTCSNPSGATSLVDTSAIIITKNQPIE